jgi:hypothetical protein
MASYTRGDRTGGRGVHIHVPIQLRWTSADVRHAVIAFGRALEWRIPDRVLPEDAGRADADAAQPRQAAGRRGGLIKPTA